MKAILVTALLFVALLFVSALGLSFSSASHAQTPAPEPVDMAKEAHHRVVVENSYVRALRFSLPAGESTLLHPHSVPYVAVTTGATEFTNVVTGKPEAHVKLADGQITYSRGGFSHLVRAEFGAPFSNVTIELLRPQGEPRNLCEKIVPGDLGACDLSAAAPDVPVASRPLFETDEIRVDSVTVRRAGDIMDKPHALPGLLVSVSGAPIKVARIPGVPTQTLHPGEMVWLPLQGEPKFTVEEGPEARLVLISFKDGAAPH
jgi:quercetin dioxygenase-like cupin family protein